MEILIEQEKALHQVEVRKSKEEIARLLHPSFLEVGESGTTYSYDSIVALMEAEKFENGFVHSQDYECIKLESNVQLLLYKSAWVNAKGEKSGYTKRSSIWVLENERWQMKYHQGTLCQEFTCSI